MISTTSMRASCRALMSAPPGCPTDEFNGVVGKICARVAGRQPDAGRALPEARLLTIAASPEHLIDQAATAAIGVVGKLVPVRRLQRGVESEVSGRRDDFFPYPGDALQVRWNADRNFAHLLRLRVID